MKRNIFSILLLVVLGSMAMLLLAGCDKEDTVTPPDEFDPPSGLQALSKDTKVTLTWIASNAADVAYYRIITRDAARVYKDSAQVNKSILTHTVENLTNGQNYWFYVQAIKTDGEKSVADSLQWGPTERFLEKNIFEFSSAYPNPSGFQFSTGNEYTMTSGSGGRPDNRANIDIWLDGRGTGLQLRCPRSVNPADTNWRLTKFATTPNINDLDTQVDIPSFSSFDTTSLTVSVNRVYWAYTADGHYVRFQVKGTSGVSPDRTVSIKTAYNRGFGAWAKK
ncbi:MAG: fibronectin type III domain-containing protein [Ignavibacteriae bacterium]|nr:fibronectin type III domain-containing protein [Ignavibacteriota bacterium]